MLTSFYELWSCGLGVVVPNSVPLEIPQTMLPPSCPLAFPLSHSLWQDGEGTGGRKGKDHRLRESNLLETAVR